MGCRVCGGVLWCFCRGFNGSLSEVCWYLDYFLKWFPQMTFSNKLQIWRAHWKGSPNFGELIGTALQIETLKLFLGVCQESVRSQSGGVSQEVVRRWSGVCQESVRSLSGVCQESVRSLSGVCQESVRSLSGVCQESVKSLSGVSQVSVGEPIQRFVGRGVCLGLHGGAPLGNWGLLWGVHQRVCWECRKRGVLWGPVFDPSGFYWGSM